VNKDGVIGNSDPIIILDILDGKTKEMSRVGMTETINNDLNPKFQTKLEVNYVFELRQVLRITVLDVDDPANLPTEYTPNVSFKKDISRGLKVRTSLHYLH
jgi:hypothetical protein